MSDLRNHKHIIIEKYQEKQQVLCMYECLIHRSKDTAKILEKISVTKKQMQNLLDWYPEYFI